LKLTSSDISEIIDGKLTGPTDLQVTDIFTDSRQLNFTDGYVFFAIKGVNHDGHQFVENLYYKGIRIFVVVNLPSGLSGFPDAAFIKVNDTVAALQKLAAFKREEFKSTVVAITGSAGKTIVKEWLADIMGMTTSVVRSPKSYNSQIGVPLSVWKLDNKYKLGIFEAGISLPGEMERIQHVIKPQIGIITNIGDAHSENFNNITVKAKEKLKLFRNANTIIFCRDNKIIRDLLLQDDNLKTKILIDWSFEEKSAEYFIKKMSLPDGKTGLEISIASSILEFEIPFTDRASVENAVTVAVASIVLGVQPEILSKGLSNLISVAMRMEKKGGINDCQLIEDYYNSDPGSLGMAIEFLKSQKIRKTTLILSDFVQSGRDEAELYKEVADLIKQTGISRFYGIGEALMRQHKLFDTSSSFFRTTDEFIKSFNAGDFKNEIILLKGARLYEFERIGKLLEQKVHQTVMEINLDAIAHNINEFRRVLKHDTRIMAMVKAFAYGAGPSEIASLLEYHRVSYLGVAYADEGVELRNAGVTLPVMVMNPDPSSADIMIKYNLEPELYSFNSFKSFVSTASRYGLINYPVHIKIDTGMHRLGFMPDKVEELAGMLRDYDSVKVVSVFSHLAASENPLFDSFTHNQVSIFLEASEKIQKATGYKFIRHILNSSGISRFPQYQFEMVRPGIGIYGIGHFENLSLRPAGRFKTRISQIKKIKAGEPVGYGCADTSDYERTIAIIPVGYADGLNRRMGNRNGRVFIGSTGVPLIGNICMDMCMADVTDLNVKEGDEAEIFGENIPIDEIAEKCQTIPYEILTSIPARVKRIFFRE
jgi:Alr-MurF fusion protein